LADTGYEVLTASDRKSGLQQCQEKRPHIVLVDAVGIDKAVFIKDVKKKDPDTQVIAITTLEELNTIRILGLSLSDFIIKPVNRDLLLVVLDRAKKRYLAHKELRQLRESQERYETLIKSSLIGIYIDHDGRIEFANKKFAQIYGYSLNELIGMESWRLVHPEHRAMTDSIRKKRIRGEDAPSEYEAKGLTKDGRTIWIKRRNVRIDYKGRPAILGNIVDVTENKQAEEALRESEERYRIVLEASPDPVVVYDMDGKVVYINPAFTHTFGWTSEELIGKRIDEVADGNWHETRAMIDKLRKTRRFSGIESRRYTKQGDILDVSISAATYLDREGIPAGSIHTLVDITEWKRAEEALRKARRELEARVRERTAELITANKRLEQEIKERERAEEELKISEEKYRTLFNYDPNPLFMVDMDSANILDVNKQATVTYQYKREDVIGKSFFQLFSVDDVQRLRQELRRQLAHKDDYVFVPKLCVIKKDEASFFVDLHAPCLQVRRAPSRVVVGRQDR